MNKKELDNLILNEIFGFGKDPSDWESKDFEKFEKRILQKFPNVKIQDLPLGKILRRLRVGYAGWGDFPRDRWEDIFTDGEISRLSSDIKERNFKQILDQYTKFTKETPPKPGVPKSKYGELKPVPGEPKFVPGEIKPVSGEIKPVSGEVRPVKAADEKAPEKKKQKGTSLRLDPKKLSDEVYVKEFAKLVANYVMLPPQNKLERERQNSKILDLKKQMVDLMKAGIPGAKELQLAIRDEVAPLQRRMQQIAESYVKDSFEQIIREELENYIKEKK